MNEAERRDAIIKTMELRAHKKALLTHKFEELEQTLHRYIGYAMDTAVQMEVTQHAVVFAQWVWAYLGIKLNPQIMFTDTMADIQFVPDREYAQLWDYLLKEPEDGEI